MRVRHVLPVVGVMAACGAGAAIASHPTLDPATVPKGFLVAHVRVSKIPMSDIARTLKRNRGDIFIEHVHLGPNEASTFHTHPAPVISTVKTGSVVLEQLVRGRCVRKRFPADFGFATPPRRPHRVVAGPLGADYYEVYLAKFRTGATVRDISVPAACGG
jgi:hypothetical protein